MNLPRAIKFALLTATIACCAATAQAQTELIEATGSISAFHGGPWTGGGSFDLGQSVTVDMFADTSIVTQTDNNGISTFSIPITSASIIGGTFGAGLNLQSGGSGSGYFAEVYDSNTGAIQLVGVTDASPPTRHFTGDLFSLSFVTDGITSTLDLIQNAFKNGVADTHHSGSVSLTNVGITQSFVAPEIDPSSAIAALTLLMGGAAVIRGRKSVKLQTA